MKAMDWHDISLQDAKGMVGTRNIRHLVQEHFPKRRIFIRQLLAKF